MKTPIILSAALIAFTLSASMQASAAAYVKYGDIKGESSGHTQRESRRACKVDGADEGLTQRMVRADYCGTGTPTAQRERASDGESTAMLLLPAVQKVRAAAHR